MTAEVEIEHEVGVEYEGQGGLRFRIEEDDTYTCVNDGKGGYKNQRGVQAYWNMHSPANPKHAETETKRATTVAINEEGAPVVRSIRGRKRTGVNHAPNTLDDIRPRPGGMRGGPAAYFIRPDGATIREALIIAPSGAPVLARNGEDRANAEAVQARALRKGFVYVGPQLTFDGVEKLVAVIESNKADYILDLREQMQDADNNRKNLDVPEERRLHTTRFRKLTALLAAAQQPIDGPKIVKELNEILQAQKLAAISPDMREAIIALTGQEISTRMAGLIEKMQNTQRSTSGDSAMDTITATITNAEVDF